MGRLDTILYWDEMVKEKKLSFHTCTHGICGVQHIA